MSMGLPGMEVLVPDFLLWIEGVPIPAAVLRSIVAVAVNHTENLPATFSLEVNDPQFLLIEAVGGLFTEGKQIKISLGYVGNLRGLIEGEITAVDVQLDQSGGLTLHIEGHDYLHAATRGTQVRPFPAGRPVSAIVKSIADELGLGAEVDAIAARTNAPMQYMQNNLDLLQGLAEQEDCQFWVEGKVLYFKRQRAGSNIVLSRGVNLISFAGHLSTAGQVGEVEVRSWDATRKQPITATAVASQSADYLSTLSAIGLIQVLTGGATQAGKGKTILHATGTATSVQEVKADADKALADQRRKLLTGSGSAVGDPGIGVGSIVTLIGMGRFSRHQYIIENVTHRIDASGYRSTFEMRQRDLAAAGSGPAVGASRRRGATDGSATGGTANGVLLATVVTTGLDDAGSLTIRLDGETEQRQARIAFFAATDTGDDQNKSAAFFLPQAGDQVVVAFVKGLANSPIVVGSLWSKKSKMPESDPDVRLLRSRSGHLIRFVDTSGQEKIEFVDHSGKNRIVFDSQHRTIEIAASDGDVTIACGSGSLIKLRGDVHVSGALQVGDSPHTVIKGNEITGAA